MHAPEEPFSHQEIPEISGKLPTQYVKISRFGHLYYIFFVPFFSYIMLLGSNTIPLFSLTFIIFASLDLI